MSSAQTSSDTFYSVHDPDSDFGGEKSYEWLRDALIHAFNPADDDGAEEEIVSRALFEAADFIAERPCECTPAMVEDHDACQRCRVLGRLGDKAVPR